MRIHSKSDKGPVRNTNQDAFSAIEFESKATFAVVCDGMGGANAGNVASETAVKRICDYIYRSYRTDMDNFEIEKLLKNAIVSANMEVYDMSLKNPELSGMGTTVVATLVRNGEAVIAHVGDSRAYLVDEKITQLTRDHSVVQSLLESGKITPEDAKVHPRKNVITRALGAEENVIVDIGQLSLKAGQTLLLCSDGLSSFAESEDILKVFKTTDEASVPEELVKLAVRGGGGDNITVVTLSV